MGKNKSSSSILILLSSLIIGATAFVYTSSTFERDVPGITMSNTGYWNLKKPLNISITDESGIKSYKLIFKTSTDETILEYEQFIEPKQLVNLLFLMCFHGYQL